MFLDNTKHTMLRQDDFIKEANFSTNMLNKHTETVNKSKDRNKYALESYDGTD